MLDRRFYAKFQEMHQIFQASIQDNPPLQDKKWYTSVLLIRLMFVYFIQKQGFFAHNCNYLLDKLHILKNEGSQESFFPFYIQFLTHLFQDENHLPGQSSKPEMATFYGEIPFLHAQLFASVVEEQDTLTISIPDTAFERIFSFFETYQWRIDEYMHQEVNTITPDVMVILFELYIDRKQAGAYYTKEDVATYISKNTIIPALFQLLQQKCAAAFAQEAPLWELLRCNPERYVHATIRSKEPLPTETTREYTRRYQYCCTLLNRLATGCITSIHDFISFNLDSQRFLLDIITYYADTMLLTACYESVTSITILDPTCGSGAFLAAASTILATIYTACLQRMDLLITEDVIQNTGTTPVDATWHDILRQVQAYPDQQFFILKSIVMQNLYGVDIMPEAAEICRLRFFLSFIARLRVQKDLAHLQTIDFHIRHGNALVGMARERAKAVSSLDKAACISALDAMLASEYGIDRGYQSDAKAYEHALQQWREAHHPFHWCIEFQAIIQRGGFDVVIGNPPYIEYSKVRHRYKIQQYETASCGNLYAAVIERSLTLCHPDTSYLGFVVPLSMCGGERFAHLRDLIRNTTSLLWLANFEIFPCRLFDDAFQRLSILLAKHASTQPSTISVTKIQRWYASERPYLLDLITYTALNTHSKQPIFPKLASPQHESILQKIRAKAGTYTLKRTLTTQTTAYFVYYQEATNYWTKAACHIPFYRKNAVITQPPHGRFLFFADEMTARIVMALMNSSLFYLWFSTYSDGFHLTHALVQDFPIGKELAALEKLVQISRQLESDIQLHVKMGTRNTKAHFGSDSPGHTIELEEYHMARSKPLLDQIDQVLATYYTLDTEDYDFIIHYDSKYRMGKEYLSPHKILGQFK